MENKMVCERYWYEDDVEGWERGCDGSVEGL